MENGHEVHGYFHAYFHDSTSCFPGDIIFFVFCIGEKPGPTPPQNPGVIEVHGGERLSSSLAPKRLGSSQEATVGWEKCQRTAGKRWETHRKMWRLTWVFRIFVQWSISCLAVNNKVMLKLVFIYPCLMAALDVHPYINPLSTAISIWHDPPLCSGHLCIPSAKPRTGPGWQCSHWFLFRFREVYHGLPYPYANHVSGICTPTFARRKLPSFATKFTNTMEHMGMI